MSRNPDVAWNVRTIARATIPKTPTADHTRPLPFGAYPVQRGGKVWPRYCVVSAVLGNPWGRKREDNEDEEEKEEAAFCSLGPSDAFGGCRWSFSRPSWAIMGHSWAVLEVS